jgi:hypothetical protein
MSYFTEAERRQSVIDGLRELADFLTDHPDVPVSFSSINTISYLPHGTDEEERAEVDRVAAVLGVTAGSPGSPDHYSAVRQFGGIAYETVAISAAHMDRHYAAQTYANSVEPEAQSNGGAR